MPLRKEKIAKFKEELITRRNELLKDLQQTTSDFINDDSSYADSVDQASADTGKSITLQIKNRDRDTLGQINEALRRIEAGNFGECERCGEAIAEARMRANLATTLCVDCKSEIESEQQRFPNRA